MPARLKRKFDIILARERRVANSVALQAIKPKPFSVWEVLIPVIFILSFMRSKEQRETFAQNLMFTKKMALEAAFEMLKRGQSKEAAMSRIAAETQDLLTSIPNAVYSDAIRQKQLEEIDLLIDHYCRLMRAEGTDYATLVADAYKTREDYAAFQAQLVLAERAVTHAARETLGSRTDHHTAARIEAATEKFRQQEAETIYSPHAL
ncbi:MAG: NF038143 family protein [Desulfobacterales bacterium]